MTRLTSVDPRLNADCDGLAREGLDGDQSIPRVLMVINRFQGSHGNSRFKGEHDGEQSIQRVASKGLDGEQSIQRGA